MFQSMIGKFLFGAMMISFKCHVSVRVLFAWIFVIGIIRRNFILTCAGLDQNRFQILIRPKWKMLFVQFQICCSIIYIYIFFLIKIFFVLTSILPSVKRIFNQFQGYLMILNKRFILL